MFSLRTCKVLVGPCCVSVAYVLKNYSNLAAVSTKHKKSGQLIDICL